MPSSAMTWEAPAPGTEKDSRPGCSGGCFLPRKLRTSNKLGVFQNFAAAGDFFKPIFLAAILRPHPPRLETGMAVLTSEIILCFLMCFGIWETSLGSGALFS